MRKHFLLSICLLLFGFSAIFADDFDLMRSRLRDHITLGSTTYSLDGSDAASPYLASYLRGLSSSATAQWQSMRRDTTYLWDDVALLSGNRSYTPAHINESYVRLMNMSRAWAYPGSALYADSALLADIRYGLDLLYRTAYNERTSMIGNWWEWRIGVPWNYGTAVSILYEQLTPEEISCYEKATAHFMRSFVKRGDLTYANQASICRNLLMLGILTSNASDVRDALTYSVPALTDQTPASRRLAAIRRQDTAIRRQRSTTRVTPYADKEGLYADGSFIQHNAIPYIGTYGIEIIAMMGYLADLIPGTSFEVPQSVIDALPVWINRAYLPAMYRGEMMLMLMGRANAGDPYSNARAAALSIIEASSLIPDSLTRTAALTAAANSYVHDQRRSPYEVSPLPVYLPVIERAFAGCSSDASDAPMSVVLAAGDKAIHQTPDWRFCLSMSSNRIGKYECYMRATGNQNTRGWYTSDGMTYLYLPTAPSHYFQYLLHVDPYRLPGTTVDLLPRGEEQSLQPIYGHGAASADEARAGGVTHRGLYSAAMMQLVGAKSDLRAKKSWFMFDREVVCLGADITMSADREVITTVENRRGVRSLSVLRLQPRFTAVRSADSLRIEAVRMAHVEGVGAYIFPDTATLYATITAEPTTVFWLSHGQSPRQASYSYILLPTATTGEARAYYEHPAVTILSNTPALQAVEQAELHTVAASFWESGSLHSSSLPAVNSDGMASLVMSEEGDTLTLSVSDPSWDRASQRLVLEGEWQLVSSTDNRVKAEVRSHTYTFLTIDQRLSLGQTVDIILVRKS